MHWISIIGIILTALGAFFLHFGNIQRNSSITQKLNAKVEEQQRTILNLKKDLEGRDKEILAINQKIQSDVKNSSTALSNQLDSSTTKMSLKIDESSEQLSENQKRILSELKGNNELDKLEKFVFNQYDNTRRVFKNKLAEFDFERHRRKSINNLDFPTEEANALEIVRRELIDKSKILQVLLLKVHDPEIKSAGLIHFQKTYEICKKVTHPKVIFKEGVNIAEMEKSHVNFLQKIADKK